MSDTCRYAVLRRPTCWVVQIPQELAGARHHSWLLIRDSFLQGRDLRNAGTGDHTWQRWQLPWPLHRLEYACVPVDRPEKTLALNTFGRINEQIPIRPQGVVEGCAHLPLEVAIEIDHKVSAGDAIDV